MKKIRWGIVGPGTIANKFAKAIKNVNGAELIGVASRSKENAKEFAERYDIKNTFLGYESMAQSGIIDAVYIATPHSFHKECAELFLKNKKHVLCEKPVCVNAMQAQELKECAKKNGVFLMEAMWTRFLPAIKEARSIVKSGQIGTIRGVSADFCYSIMPEEDRKVFSAELAGGSLLDVGVYGLHFTSLFIEDEPIKIISQADVSGGIDLHTCVTLKYPKGEIATISSAINILKPQAGYIYGSRGYIYLPCFYGAKELIVKTDNEERRIEKPPMGDGFEEEIYEVCSCIRNGKTISDDMPIDDSIKILKQMDYIRKEIGVTYPFE